ncbi:uncharacterized protein TrAtP1_001265 [Trichoderma atroviride]|uniref:uncharacterized protein n=1 Tax=Hypocrea atroviridis TaxID=63577 RepID=UPI0033220C9E|nr:hypothetical protein TrAtP1_001265 [Trichoderma atroviride]
MDQLLTNLWTRGGWFRAFTPPCPAANDSITSAHNDLPKGAPILNVSSDVLLLIGDYLDASELLCLKLACRSTCSPLIEKDPLGRGTFYCAPCNKLHAFQQTTGPASELEHTEEKRRHGKCSGRDRFSPLNNPFGLSYAHARLAVNRHLYGAEHGIPLANLCLEHSEQRDGTTIKCSTSAKMMDGELFLQRTYVFAVAETDVAAFRKCTGARDFKLCEHTSFFSGSSAFRQYIPELQQKPLTGGHDLVPCREAPGSCGLCLMDYDITIEPCTLADSGIKSWRIVIRAIHQLGDCRSPEDWKWARFTEACRPHLFFPNRPNRRGSAYNPGMVQKRWADDEREACAVLDGRESNRGLFGLSFLT